MYKNLKKKTDGFTIIEVLIVLAIAALIMLIVFIAVPALQRNARNNEIRNKASRLATATVEFKTNANGKPPTSTEHKATLINMASMLSTDTIEFAPGSVTPENTYRVVAEGGQCNVDKVATGNPNTRAVAVEFGLNGGGVGCIES